MSRSARPGRRCSPLRPPPQLAPGSAGLRRRLRARRPAPARCRALKSRGHSRSALGWVAAVPRETAEQLPAAAALSGGGADRSSRNCRWKPAIGLRRPDSDNCPLLRCEGEGDARRPRLALAQLQPPVRAGLSVGSSSSPLPLPSPGQPKAQERFAKVRSGPLCSRPSGSGKLVAGVAARLFPRAGSRRSRCCQQRRDLRASSPGKAGDGTLRVLPKHRCRGRWIQVVGEKMKSKG